MVGSEQCGRVRAGQRFEQGTMKSYDVPKPHGNFKAEGVHTVWAHKCVQVARYSECKPSQEQATHEFCSQFPLSAPSPSPLVLTFATTSS